MTLNYMLGILFAYLCCDGITPSVNEVSDAVEGDKGRLLQEEEPVEEEELQYEGGEDDHVSLSFLQVRS